MADPIYPHFDKEEGITHLGANVFWTVNTKSMIIFLKALSNGGSMVVSLAFGQNQEMFFAVAKIQ